MRRCARRIGLLVVLLAACGCSTVGRNVPGIENFDTVEKGVLYRGAQPTRRGIQTLADAGVKTVVNLRDDAQRWEKDAVEKAGMRYIVIPSDAGKVEPGKVDRFLQVMKSARGPVFVHCHVGRDRTGLNVGAYRIVEQGWDRQRAIRELHDHGYHSLVFPGIERFLRSFDKDGLRRRPGIQEGDDKFLRARRAG